MEMFIFGCTQKSCFTRLWEEKKETMNWFSVITFTTTNYHRFKKQNIITSNKYKCSLGSRPKTNPSADRFQYRARYTGSDICAGWGLGTRLVQMILWKSEPLVILGIIKSLTAFNTHIAKHHIKLSTRQTYTSTTALAGFLEQFREIV